MSGVSDVDAAGAQREILEHVASGAIQLALAAARRSMEAFPDHPLIAVTAARAYHLAGDHEATAAVARRALALGYKGWRGPALLGNAELALGRPLQAARALLAAYRYQPDHVETACLLLQAGVTARGVDHCRELYAEIAARIADAAPRRIWARLLFDGGLYEPAAQSTAGYLDAPLQSVEEWARRSGAPFAWRGDAERVDVAALEPVGEPAVPPCRKTLVGSAPYAITIPDATILSQSSIVLTADGTALHDLARDPEYGRLVDFVFDQSVIARREDRVLIDRADRPVDELDAGVMLIGASSNAFGHWMPEYLGRLQALERHPDFPCLPVIVDAAMPASHVDYLRRMVSNPLVTLPAGGALRCNRLVVAPTTSRFLFSRFADDMVPEECMAPILPGTLRYVRQRMLAGGRSTSAPSRRLYVTRRSTSRRRLLNEVEIEPELMLRGFETIDPDGMSFDDQFAAFRDAAAIVAPNGSALLNLIFCDPAAKLLVLTQPNLYAMVGYYGPLRELGFNPLILRGDAPVRDNMHADFSIPLGRFRAALDALGV